MIFYFILGLSVAALILEGKCRNIVLSLALMFHVLNLHFGFKYPDFAYPLSYEERWMDTISRFDGKHKEDSGSTAFPTKLRFHYTV